MDNNFRNTLLVSALVFASSIYHTTVNSAQAAPTKPPVFSDPVDPTSMFTQSSISVPAFASPPIGYIAEGMGAAIAIAETEIVLASQTQPHITRAVFTHGIAKREPIDTIVSISQSYGKMYFFTELSNFKGERIKHRWEHEGEIVAEVEFEIGAPRWRAYSSKNISDTGLGTWTVFVTDSVGMELFSNSIIVVN